MQAPQSTLHHGVVSIMHTAHTRTRIICCASLCVGNKLCFNVTPRVFVCGFVSGVCLVSRNGGYLFGSLHNQILITTIVLCCVNALQMRQVIATATHDGHCKCVYKVNTRGQHIVVCVLSLRICCTRLCHARCAEECNKYTSRFARVACGWAALKCESNATYIHS